MEAQLLKVSQLDSIRVVYYPVLTLPPEITSEIFLHCLPATRSLDSVDTSAAPLLLMQRVEADCRLHACVVDVNARLIWVHFSEIFDIWLGRARQSPLSVKIVGPLSRIDDFDRFLETFHRYSGGMRSLDLDMTLEDFEKMDGNHPTFALLEDLTIHVDTWTEGTSIMIKMFNDVPTLREVRLIYAPTSFIAPPWEQLTKFTGEWYTVEECLDVLRLMPDVSECALSVQPNDFPLGPIFHLSSSVSTAGTDILHFLTLPSLHTLEIFDPDDTFDNQAFESFLLRSASPLRNLTIRGDVEINITSFLAVPDLTHLEIWRPPFGFIQVLFDSFGHDTSLLPRLQHLSFLGCWGGGASVSDVACVAAAPIIERMKSRNGFAPLQSFRLVVSSRNPLIPSCWKKKSLPFIKLKADGMEIYIGTELESYMSKQYLYRYQH